MFEQSDDPNHNMEANMLELLVFVVIAGVIGYLIGKRRS